MTFICEEIVVVFTAYSGIAPLNWTV